MTTVTVDSYEISDGLIQNYFKSLVNQFFKILPMRENNEPSLQEYMNSLMIELVGIRDLIEAIGNDPLYLRLIALLEYLINHPECSVRITKREVFKAISICNKLSNGVSNNRNASKSLHAPQIKEVTDHGFGVKYVGSVPTEN